MAIFFIEIAYFHTKIDKNGDQRKYSLFFTRNVIFVKNDHMYFIIELKMVHFDKNS